MKKKIWDLYAPIYKQAMKADQKIYNFMYERIPQKIRGMEVLEIATGPGLLARHVAPAAKRMVATDYSDGMIAEAKKGECPANLTFEVADAMNLPYADNSFDAVLIAPTFVEHKGTLGSRIWSGILKIAGIRFEHQWSAQEYLKFLEDNGWTVEFSKPMEARITMMYTECRKQ